MATNFSPCFCSDEEEDYIDMDLSFSSTNFLYCSPNSSPQSRDFEFQMSSISIDKGTTTSTADELFYKGQLLPLHLPPRLQMVQNHLQTSIATFETTKQGFKEENHPKTPFINSSSPLESCRVSCELNRDNNFFELSSELLISSFNKQYPKNSWSKKMKLIKQSILVQKLKASRAYLKSLFSNSACNLEADNLSKSTIMKSIDKEGVGNNNVRRRSFSGAIKRHSATNRSSFSLSSSSSSFNSSGFQEFHFLKWSSSAIKNECSIEAAIAHCKKSQQISQSRINTSKEAGFCSM